MLKKTLVYILCFPFAPILAADQFYDLKDLEVLDRQKNFEEFILHVNDIRPSERGKHWKEMFQTMSVGLIDYKIKTKDFTRKSFERIEQIGRSSALADDEYYQLKRAIFAKKYLTECFKIVDEKSKCENELSSYWYFSSKDPDIGLELASILETNQSTMNRWPFYQVAIKSTLAPLYCSRPEFQKVIIQKINKETYTEDFDNNYKALLDKYVPNICFTKLVGALRDELLSPSAGGASRELAMNLLEAKNLLTPTEQDLYSILYLLNGPVVGEKMNIAWKKTEALSDNFSKRQKILEMIQRLELIPDAIFKDPNLPRHKAIINLFAKNFPEFLNFYGKACMDYITNKTESTTNLPSTFQCHQFLKTAKNNSTWISDSIQSQYSALKK
jgi:hypothetical protein